MTRRNGILINSLNNQLVVRVGILCGLTLWLSIAVSHECFSAPPPVREADDSDAPDEAVPDDSALSHSAVPLRDRVLRERLRRIEAFISRREFTSAIAEVRQAASDEPVGLIKFNESTGVWQQYHDRHSAVEGLLRSLQADAQALYLRQVEPLARSRFRAAVRVADLKAIQRLPLKFPLTEASRDALRFMMARYLDRREFAAADAVARRLLRDSSLSVAHRVAARRTIEFCASDAAGQGELARSSDSAFDSGNSQRIHPPNLIAKEQTEPVLSLRARLFPSLKRPVWQVDSGLDDETAMLARHALHEHFEQSIPILPRAQPLILGDIVVRRSLDHLSAHTLETGELLWSDESESDAGQSASRLTMNLSLQELMAQKLARGLQVDSLQSRLTTDGRRVYSVESGGGVAARRSSGGPASLMGSGYRSQSRNRIVAREIRTGAAAWTLTADAIISSISESQPAYFAEQPRSPRESSTGSAAAGKKPDVRDNSSNSADVFFCGLPTAVDQDVVGLVQVDDALWVYAVDQRSGRIDWSHHIAEAARQSPADADWRSLDCRITLVDGVLVCPTGAGLLVGVDLATRSTIWCRRYTRFDMPLGINRLPVAAARPQRPWWRGWRDLKLLAVASAGGDNEATGSGYESPVGIPESIVVATGPDADGLRAINPRTGQLLWHQPVESPVDMLSAGGRIIVVSRHRVSAFAADSGEVVWRVACRESVGTGYTMTVTTENVGETVYHVYPARGGSLVAVNLKNGATVESVDTLESLTGCLMEAGDRVISLNSDRMTVWPILAAEKNRQLAGTDSPMPESSDSVWAAAIDTAAFDRSSGLFDLAAARLRELPESPTVKRELEKTLVAWLYISPQSGQNVTLIATELEQLAGEQSIADLISIRHAAARAAAQSGSPLVAMDFYARLQTLNPSGEPRFLKPEPLRSVRHDRLVQGELIDLIRSVDESVALSLHTEFAELAKAAEGSRDPFALQRFARQWRELPMAAEQVLDERSRIGLRYGQKQLELLTLAESSEQNIAITAAQKLIELYESRSYSRDAAAIRRRFHGIETDEKTLPATVGSPWNSGPAKVSEHPEQNLDTTFIPVPVKCQPGTLFDRLNVAINPRSSRDETVLRFYGDGISGYWQTVLTTSASPLKSVGRMYRGWGIGHFLVLQLGGELFGISPFDGSGEPRVQRLWSIDMTNGNRQEDHQYAVAIPGFAEEELTMLDAFGRPIAKVGPVRAGYLCFQTRGKLVCLDTSTGQRLWQRYELPRNAVCTGDGQRVFMVQPGEDMVTVLRVVDGATESQFPLSAATGFAGIVLDVTAGRVLTGQRSPDSDKHHDVLRLSKIASVNLQSEDVEWSADVEPDSTVFAIGVRWVGILKSMGGLQIVDRLSGEEVASLHVQRPDRIRTVHVSSDSSSHLIALSETAESVFLNGRSVGRDARNPPVTGQLLAIDSLTADLLWQRPVDRIQFLLDQPKNAPCVVLSYRRSRSSETEAMDSVLHVMNRVTGEDILNRRGSGAASAFTFEPHADQNRLSIRMARKSIRLTFAHRQTP